MASIKQKKAVKAIIENHGNVSKGMLEAGYTPATAKNPKNLTSSIGFKEEIAPVLLALKKERDAAIKAMVGKRGRAKYRDLTDAIDKLTKNMQLLSGKPTDINNYNEFSDEQIDAIARRISGNGKTSSQKASN